VAQESLRARTVRRLVGIDRSGPAPEPTLAGQPLHPWTIPNAIGFARLIAVPVFLIVALNTENGEGAFPAILYAAIGWADYLDGFTARLTGQFSRLGALLDPIIDRMLIVSGAVVCWNFSLLPRWAILLVIVRELSMLVLSRYCIHRGIEIKINWAGRIGVAPMMGAPFFAMAGVHWLALIMLYVGLALSISSTIMYLRRGRRELHKLAKPAA
jgi:cardiolipin synthase (CMP-forming)